MDKVADKPSIPRKREPLAVNVTLVVRTGPEPENQFTLLDNRKIPMVGSVFEYRNRISRFFVSSLLRVAATSPSVYRELAPGLGALLGRVKTSRKTSASTRNTRSN